MPLYVPRSPNRRPWRAGLATLVITGVICVIPAQALVRIRERNAITPLPAVSTAPTSTSPLPPLPVPTPPETSSTTRSVGRIEAGVQRIQEGAARSYRSAERSLHRQVDQTRKQLAQLPSQIGLEPGAGSDMIHLEEEISLQESLDRLGYTVNVPSRYGGHPVLYWRDGYRHSTGDDSLSADWLRSSGSVTLKTLGQQGMLAPNTGIGFASDSGHHLLMNPAGDYAGLWLDPSGEHPVTTSFNGVARPYEDIQNTGGGFASGQFFSSASMNPDGTDHLLMLPARTGGSWVDEGDHTGHWEGGQDTGKYLLCWEDWIDNDYQDLIILAEGVQPVDQP